MNVIKINESKLRKIIEESVKNILSESVNLSEITTINGEDISVERFNMDNEEDKAFIVSNKDKIWAILLEGYSDLGGFKGYESIRDMLHKSPFFDIGFCNGEIVTVAVYNDYLGGNKCVGLSCIKDEKHKIAVQILELIIKYNIKNWNDWVWIEASGKVEKMCKELGAFNLPSKYVSVYLRHNDYKIADEYHYVRTIGKIEMEKTIFGFKDQNTFDFLKKELDDEILTNIGEVKKDTLTESDEIFNRYYNTLSEIWKQKTTVDYFVHLKDDMGVNEFTPEAMNVLVMAISNIKRLMEQGECKKEDIRRMNLTIEEGERVIETSTILEPLVVSV